MVKKPSEDVDVLQLLMNIFNQKGKIVFLRAAESVPLP